MSAGVIIALRVMGNETAVMLAERYLDPVKLTGLDKTTYQQE